MAESISIVQAATGDKRRREVPDHDNRNRDPRREDQGPGRIQPPPEPSVHERPQAGARSGTPGTPPGGCVPEFLNQACRCERDAALHHPFTSCLQTFGPTRSNLRIPLHFRTICSIKNYALFTASFMVTSERARSTLKGSADLPNPRRSSANGRAAI